MRVLLCVVAAVLFAGSSVRADDSEETPRETVTFDGETLVFAFEGTNPGETFKEYIPEDETLETWARFASLRQYPDVDDPLKLAQLMADGLQRSTPGAQSAIGKNEETGEVIIDFITWPADHSFVEFNIFRFRQNEANGTDAQQYAMRAYENELEFLQGLKELREKLVPLMAKDGLVLHAPAGKAAEQE